MMLFLVPLFLCFLSFIPPSLAAYRPLVIWHGLGDTYSSPGIRQFEQEIKDIYPGIFIHSVYIDENADRDRRAGFYGNVNEQIDLVARQLSSVPELRRGFDAIGFSQGGQFLRAYVERFNSPPVHNLITFGSQHMGISDIPGCRKYDVVCQLARNAAKSAVYGEWAQNNIVQAQYYRDPTNYNTYLEANKFLTSINNELAESRNQSYARRLASLNQLILVGFSEDKTVVPKESAFFGSEPIQEVPKMLVQTSTAPDRVIIPMRLQRLYLEDWIGLRRLDIRRAIKFEVCEGEHMQIGDCWEDIVRNYVGGYVRGSDRGMDSD